MAKKPRLRRKPRTMSLEQFHRDRPALIAAARKPGGVDIVNPDGTVRLHVTIPHSTIPDIW